MTFAVESNASSNAPLGVCRVRAGWLTKVAIKVELRNVAGTLQVAKMHVPSGSTA